ncbi:hypothetical protein EXIGLDRAFT_760618 [Exidia glandulosa HHB12029]|uniref:Zinc finger PHD-type domain-containing protein n=1 Tax=Exidia glandulosa HHB12029 TaxID=1314781 RepID=A0A165P6D9_EXIGL|nr:hypothetical protein EXIGLDRAFT_760618 [Exidia glandulosa HHB12029]
MSAHILCDPALKASRGQCGFCLWPNEACKFFLKNVDSTAKSPQIVFKDSVCPKLPTRLSYAAAARSSKSAPSTNIPVQCPLCPKRSPAVWKYSLREHISLTHVDANENDFKALWDIASSERTALRAYYKRVTSTIRRPRTTAPASSAIIISEAHTSRLAMRTTDLVVDGNIPQDAESESVVDDGDDDDIDLDFPSDTDSNSRDASPDSLFDDIEGDEADRVPVAQPTAGVTEGSADLATIPTSSVPAATPMQNPAPQAASSSTAVPPPLTVRTRRGRQSSSLLVMETCNCGKGPVLLGGQARPDAALNMIECTKPGCEIRFYHRACVGLVETAVPRRWVCSDCNVEPQSKRRRL